MSGIRKASVGNGNCCDNGAGCGLAPNLRKWARQLTGFSQRVEEDHLEDSGNKIERHDEVFENEGDDDDIFYRDFHAKDRRGEMSCEDQIFGEADDEEEEDDRIDRECAMMQALGLSPTRKPKRCPSASFRPQSKTKNLVPCGDSSPNGLKNTRKRRPLKRQNITQTSTNKPKQLARQEGPIVQDYDQPNNIERMESRIEELEESVCMIGQVLASVGESSVGHQKEPRRIPKEPPTVHYTDNYRKPKTPQRSSQPNPKKSSNKPIVTVTPLQNNSTTNQNSSTGHGRVTPISIQIRMPNPNAIDDE